MWSTTDSKTDSSVQIFSWFFVLLKLYFGDFLGHGPDNTKLKQVRLNVKAGSNCNVYDNFVKKNMLCVGGQLQQDTCQVWFCSY